MIYDAAVIGGGIAGAGIAREAARRGLSVVLFEKNTFGSGTSSKSSKLIHGGLRYLDVAWTALKTGEWREAWKNFRFVLVSLRECRLLAKMAPDLVQPLQLVIPVYKGQDRSAVSVYFGTLFYAVLGILKGNFRLPTILWGSKSVLKRIPPLKADGLVGGVIIWDHWTQDRLLVERMIASAAAHGAKALEHAHVVGYRYDSSSRCYEIHVQQEGAVRVWRARSLVNASGPWVDQVRRMAGEDGEAFLVPVAGSHITVTKFVEHAVILKADDGRVFFVIPIGQTCRVGTTERMAEDPDQVEPEEKEIEYLLRSLKLYFPSLPFRKEDILSKDAGIRPLARPRKAQNPHLISRDHEVRIGPTGVLHVLGVKLTDHRRAAEEVVGTISKRARFR